MIDDPVVLLTGFEAFGGEAVNPSQEIVRSFEGTRMQGHRIVTGVLPVAFAPVLPLLERLLDEHRPTLVLALGQAGGRSALALERVAINLIDARIADNEGRQPIDATVVAGAAQAYFSSLPIKAMQAHLRSLGIPVELSMSAGTFVCNQVFFALAHLRATRYPELRCGFMHVPWLPEQAARYPGQPSMALDTMRAGVGAAIECALATHRDLQVAAGTTH
jgi:pyroglutamyl-peptidase